MKLSGGLAIDGNNKISRTSQFFYPVCPDYVNSCGDFIRLDNLGLVLIDYLQLMTAAAPGKSGDNRVTVVSDISRALKIMAKELNVPVICLSQLSRANESRTDKRPMLSDLRESGAIEQDADSVMFLYRDEYYNPNTQDKNIAECIVAKNRHGETGTVKLQWRPQFFTFSDLEWKHDG